MKKILILLAVGLAGSMGVYAVTQPTPPSATLKTPPKVAPLLPPTNDAAEGDVGSGDDIDTVNEADPANDKDPELDDSAPAKAQ